MTIAAPADQGAADHVAHELADWRRMLPVIGGTLLCVVATVAVGWWGPGAIGLAWGAWPGRRGAAKHATMVAAASGSLSWVVVLIWTAVSGPLHSWATTLGALAGIPGFVLIGVTVLFPGLLAGSAACVADAIVTTVHRGPKARQRSDPLSPRTTSR